MNRNGDGPVHCGAPVPSARLSGIPEKLGLFTGTTFIAGSCQMHLRYKNMMVTVQLLLSRLD